MSEEKSYRQILKSSSIIGGSSIINILVGLVRTKAVAVLLGPAGIGLMGLLQNLITTATTISMLGINNVGTRQIAEAAGINDEESIAAARRALFWISLVLACLGGLVFWLFRNILADKVLDDINLGPLVGWLAIGVTLSVASGSQNALLNGLRQIGNLARISIYSAILSSIAGVTALWLWGQQGIVAFILSAPLASFILGHWYVSCLPKITTPATPLPQLIKQWKTLVRLGAAFMVAGLAVTAGQLAVRTMVQRELGAEALGHFQAAWAISMLYIGFVLQAMGTDYYPRLTATINDHAMTNRLVNEQTEVALLLACPVFLAMLGLAPWVIELLYSDQFTEAATILRWQIMGDILKVAAWPLGFIILSAGDGRTFMLSDSLAIAVFVLLTWLGLPLLGIQATGMAFLGMYMVYLPVVYYLARRRTGFSWHGRVVKLLLLLITLAIGIFIAALWSNAVSAVLSVITAVMMGIYSLTRLSHMADLSGRLGKLAQYSNNILSKIRKTHE